MGRQRALFESEDRLSINEFLSSYSTQRHLDNVFRKWFYKKDNSNPKKTVSEWQSLEKEFRS